MISHQRVALISDLHLSPNTPELLAILQQSLQHYAMQFDALFILGDLFDAWIGDDILDADPRFNQITQGFAMLAQFGKKIYLNHGNRDFLIGDHFANRAQLSLLPEQIVVELGGKKVLLSHGDELCTDDVAYQAFRQQARNRQWQAQMLAQPIPARLQLASQLRTESMSATANKSQEIMDVNQLAVQNALDQHHVNIMIHGHTHRPHTHHWQHNNQTFERWVLSDWRTSQNNEPAVAELLLIQDSNWQRINLTKPR